MSTWDYGVWGLSCQSDADVPRFSMVGVHRPTKPERASVAIAVLGCRPIPPLGPNFLQLRDEPPNKGEILFPIPITSDLQTSSPPSYPNSLSENSTSSLLFLSFLYLPNIQRCSVLCLRGPELRLCPLLLSTDSAAPHNSSDLRTRFVVAQPISQLGLSSY